MGLTHRIPKNKTVLELYSSTGRKLLDNSKLWVLQFNHQLNCRTHKCLTFSGLRSAVSFRPRFCITNMCRTGTGGGDNGECLSGSGDTLPTSVCASGESNPGTSYDIGGCKTPATTTGFAIVPTVLASLSDARCGMVNGSTSVTLK